MLREDPNSSRVDLMIDATSRAIAQVCSGRSPKGNVSEVELDELHMDNMCCEPMEPSISQTSSRRRMSRPLLDDDETILSWELHSNDTFGDVSSLQGSRISFVEYRGTQTEKKQKASPKENTAQIRERRVGKATIISSRKGEVGNFLPQKLKEDRALVKKEVPVVEERRSGYPPVMRKIQKIVGKYRLRKGRPSKSSVVRKRTLVSNISKQTKHIGKEINTDTMMTLEDFDASADGSPSVISLCSEKYKAKKDSNILQCFKEELKRKQTSRNLAGIEVNHNSTDVISTTDRLLLLQKNAKYFERENTSVTTMSFENIKASAHGSSCVKPPFSGSDVMKTNVEALRRTEKDLKNKQMSTHQAGFEVSRVGTNLVTIKDERLILPLEEAKIEVLEFTPETLTRLTEEDAARVSTNPRKESQALNLLSMRTFDNSFFEKHLLMSSTDSKEYVDNRLDSNESQEETVSLPPKPLGFLDVLIEGAMKYIPPGPQMEANKRMSEDKKYRFNDDNVIIEDTNNPSKTSSVEIVHLTPEPC